MQSASRLNSGGHNRNSAVVTVCIPLVPEIPVLFTRVALFLATNLAVLALASVVMSLLGVNSSQMGGLLVFAAIFGFGGSLISLLTSKWMAKRATGAMVIEQPRNDAERWLVATVQRQAQAAGIVARLLLSLIHI